MFLSVTIQNHQNGITLLPYTITNIGQTETFCDIFTAILAKENLDENIKQWYKARYKTVYMLRYYIFIECNAENVQINK